MAFDWKKNTLLLCILFAQCFLSHPNSPSTHVRTMKGSVRLFSYRPDPICWFQSNFAICVHSEAVPLNLHSFHTLGAFYMLCSFSCFPSGAYFFCHFSCDSFFLWLFNFPSLLLFSLFTFRHSVLPCRVSTKHLSIHKLCLSLMVYCLFLSTEQKLVETNTWLSLCQLIMLEPWSQQVLTAAGCHNAEHSLGGCNCQVTAGVAPKGLFKVVLWHSGSLQWD